MAQSGSGHYLYQQNSAGDQAAMQQHDVSHMYSFGEDESSLLDPAILDPGVMAHQHDLQYRRDSYPQAHGMISQSEQTWETYPMMPMDRSLSTQYHDEHSTYDSQTRSAGGLVMTTAWQAHQDSPAAPSTAPMSTDTTIFPATKNDEHTRMNHDLSQNPMMNEQPYFSTQQSQTPVTPQSHKDWMAFAQQEIESRPLTKRPRPGTPPRSLLDLRRDGAIQKKNKRIDIPQERNIQTIDQMIENTKDEDLLKELKAQKRLLRNREAALASRQRKKKHTEDLEKSEKGYMSQITGLEKQVEALSIERNNLQRDREILIHRHQDADRVIESMHMEKRDLIMKHTEETASLRKKVEALKDQLERTEALLEHAQSAPSAQAVAMSAAPSSAGMPDFNAEMEALTMDNHVWPNYMLADTMHQGFDFGAPQSESRRLPAQESVPPAVEPITADKTTVGSGLLFMLLLCGAFVASQQASPSGVRLPAMPPAVRAAAPAVLDSLLSDNSMPTEQSRQMQVKQEPQPSMLARPNARADRMGKLHRSLTAPTRQQEIDSAFALTPTQYAALANMDQPNEDLVGQGSITPRQTLAQALAETLPTATENKAAVYTRSLLFDQIPADVVQQFRQLVQSRAQPVDRGHGFKQDSHD